MLRRFGVRDVSVFDAEEARIECKEDYDKS